MRQRLQLKLDEDDAAKRSHRDDSDADRAGSVIGSVHGAKFGGAGGAAGDM